MMATVAMALLLGSVSSNAVADVPQQTLYFGGNIITMKGDEPTYVEAVIERDGKIVHAGKKAGAVGDFAGETIEVDLQG